MNQKCDEKEKKVLMYLKWQMKQKNITYEQLSERIELTELSVYRLMNGITKMRMAQLLRICEVLNIRLVFKSMEGKTE